MNKVDMQYQVLLQELVDLHDNSATVNADRTGVGTYSLFHRSLRFNLQEGFPILTTKFVSLKSVLGELLWFLSGNTNAYDLEMKYGCTIWQEWARANGELGKVYGHQWRNFGSLSVERDGWFYEKSGFDQIVWLINEIKTNPTSRRLYVTAANPDDRYDQELDCCHNYFQVVIKDGKLSLYFQMRSTDTFLGLPYNIASYAALAHMLALETGYEVGELVYSGVDVHLYTNHIEQAKLQLSREPKALPKLVINKKPFFEYELSDFKLEGYEYHPAIKADVAV